MEPQANLLPNVGQHIDGAVECRVLQKRAALTAEKTMMSLNRPLVIEKSVIMPTTTISEIKWGR